MEAVLVVLVVWCAVAFALYWVIRLAVRHALADARAAERERESRAHFGEALNRSRVTGDGS